MSTLMTRGRAPLFVLSLLFLFTSSLAQAVDESGYLGVFLQDLEPSMAKALQMDGKSGVLISNIVDDSPAEEAGLEDGDVILVFNGEKTASSGDLTMAVRDAGPGEKVDVVVLRAGKKKTIEVVLGEREDDVNTWTIDKLSQFHGQDGDSDTDDFFVDRDVMFFDGDRGFLGVHLDDLNEQLGEYFGVEDGAGVLVTEVVDDSPAEKAGIKAGDVIVKVGDEKVDSSAELHKAMAGTEADQKLSIEVRRKGDKKKFEVTLGEAKENKFIKKIEILGDDGHFNVHSPKMKMHMAPNVEYHKQFKSGEVEEIKQELKKMKKELKELKKELNK